SRASRPASWLPPPTSIGRVQESAGPVVQANYATPSPILKQLKDCCAFQLGTRDPSVSSMPPRLDEVAFCALILNADQIKDDCSWTPSNVSNGWNGVFGLRPPGLCWLPSASW